MTFGQAITAARSRGQSPAQAMRSAWADVRAGRASRPPRGRPRPAGPGGMHPSYAKIVTRTARKQAREWKRVPRVNPPMTGAVRIYDAALAIEARKGSRSQYPGKAFRHEFKSRPVVWGLPDGSLLIRPKHEGARS